MQELHSTTTSSAQQLKVVRDSRAMGHKLGRGPPHFLGRQSLGSCCMLGGMVGLNPSISADPAFPNNFVELAGDSWLHGGGALWRRVSCHLLLLLCKQSWHRKGPCCPQEGLQAHRRVVWPLQAALHQPACKLSAHPPACSRRAG